MTSKILIVDDEPRVSRLVTEVLTAVGYQVVVAASGGMAIQMVALEQPDLVLLDILLPQMDGYQVCSRLREFTDVPIIMLTAKARDTDILRGFDVGADDYLTKPFNSKELVARVKAVLRRRETETAVSPTQKTITIGDLTIDPKAHTVNIAGREIDLTPREFDLLHALAQEPGRVQSIDDLLAQVWGAEFKGEPQVVYVHIRWLRKKIETDPRNPTRIVTVHGVGYKFEITNP